LPAFSKHERFIGIVLRHHQIRRLETLLTTRTSVAFGTKIHLPLMEDLLAQPTQSGLKYSPGAKKTLQSTGVCTMARKILLTLALIVAAFLMTACQTVQGLGEDIKWTGQKAAELIDR
jgi:predicted small secreted protein